MNRSKRRSVALRPCIAGIEQLESICLLSGNPPLVSSYDDNNPQILPDPYYNGDPGDAPLIDANNYDSSIGSIEGGTQQGISESSTGGMSASDLQTLIDSANAARNQIVGEIDANIQANDVHKAILEKSKNAVSLLNSLAELDYDNMTDQEKQSETGLRACYEL